MTYNFDPDRWYADELAALERCLASGRMTPQEFESARTALDERYEEMWRRLDGSYRIPPAPRP